MGAAVNIRSATASDIDTLRELWEALYAECPEPDHERKEWRQVALDVRGAVEDAVVLIAEEDGAAVGFALGRARSERVGYVSDLYVRPRHRNRGIARELLRRAAGELGREVLTLDVDVMNSRARAFYRRLGFGEQSLRLAIDSGRLSEAEQRAPSFGSVHVQTDDAGAVARAVRQFVPRLPGKSRGSVVAPPRNGWVAVYDELCDREPSLLGRLARELSDRMGAVTLAVGVERGEVVRYLLYERGRMVDEYLSVPTHYGELPPGDAVALGANATVVARLTGARAKEFRAIARSAASPRDLPEAPELLAAIAGEMGVEGTEHGYREAVAIPGAEQIASD
jgi:ribosomal protein S18 acetylase RimI-like enzyme